MWEIERWWWLFEVVPPVAQQPQSMAELTEGKDLQDLQDHLWHDSQALKKEWWIRNLGVRFGS